MTCGQVELAELLVELHPWAAAAGGMVRYARGGGEIMMMAVRIARARLGPLRHAALVSVSRTPSLSPTNTRARPCRLTDAQMHRRVRTCAHAHTHHY